MKKLDLEQNTPEWENFRRSRIGASDIGIIMEGSDKDLYNLMQEKLGKKQKYITPAMQRGSEMEPEAIEWLLGKGKSSKVCALHSKPDDWLMASFDYLDMKSKILVEVKCPKMVLDLASEHTHFKRWWWQCQTQMAVSGLEEAILLPYHPLKQAKMTIHRDDQAIVDLKAKGREFHRRLMSFDILKDPGELDFREDEAAEDWATKIKEIDGPLKELTACKKVMRDEGIALANGNPFECSGVKVKKVLNQPSFDYEAACTAHGIDMEPFKILPKDPYKWVITIS